MKPLNIQYYYLIMMGWRTKKAVSLPLDASRGPRLPSRWAGDAQTAVSLTAKRCVGAEQHIANIAATYSLGGSALAMRLDQAKPRVVRESIETQQQNH